MAIPLIPVIQLIGGLIKRGIAKRRERKYKEAAMHKIQAFFGALVDPKDSAAYAGWGALVMQGLCLFNESTCKIVQNLGGQATITTLITYAVMRMTSKGAKAKAPAPTLEK